MNALEKEMDGCTFAPKVDPDVKHVNGLRQRLAQQIGYNVDLFDNSLSLE